MGADEPDKEKSEEQKAEELRVWREAISKALRDENRAKQPKLLEALWEDAKIYSGMLMGPPKFKTKPGFLLEVARLSWTSDSFFSLLLYRVRTRLAVHDVPVLPRLLHYACMAHSQMNIGDSTIVAPGVYFPHGQVVIDGIVEIGTGTVIAPFVTIGRNGASLHGPSIGDNVFIGTGARLFGEVKIGFNSVVGANSVVVADVKPFTSVGGIPAKVIQDRRDGPEYQALIDGIRKKKEEAKAAAEAASAAAHVEPPPKAAAAPEGAGAAREPEHAAPAPQDTAATGNGAAEGGHSGKANGASNAPPNGTPR